MVGMTIASLAEVDVARWFDVDDDLADRAKSIAGLQEAITRGQIDPALRWLALVDGKVVARFAARRDPRKHLYFWQPKTRPNVSAEARRTITEGFLALADALAARDPGFVALETKPADDLPHIEEWLGALEGHGFRELACARIFDRARPVAAPLASEHAALVPVEDFSDDTMAELIRQCDEGSSDRVDLDRENPLDHWAEIRRTQIVPWRPSLSAVATHDGAPVGVVLGGVEVRTGDGWILYVGVTTAARRSGLGGALLGRALTRFDAEEVARVRALIDDQNVASIRLHAAHGFVRGGERFMTYRKLNVAAS